MSKSLEDIARELDNNDKKVQLIYAFNGTGKTRLSREFKQLISPKLEDDNEHGGELKHKRILYYSSFTEDLFYWDNDLRNDSKIKLKIHKNSFTDWVFIEQGLEDNVTKIFQHYTHEKLTPNFNEEYIEQNANGDDITIPAYSEVTFSYASGDDSLQENIKISKGEESNFVWSVFYSLLEQIISELNIVDIEDRATDKFNNLEYVFIDDPVSSLDENHLIELAVNVAQLIKSSKSKLKFVITTHNPLFYNVLWHEFRTANKFILEKFEGNPDTYSLKSQDNDSPFSYHLYLKNEIEKAIRNNNVQKYHFNLLRNLLEKTANFLGYEKWGDLLPRDPDGSNPTEARLTRMINLYNHSSHSGEDAAIIKPEEKMILENLINRLNSSFGFNSNLNDN